MLLTYGALTQYELKTKVFFLQNKVVARENNRHLLIVMSYIHVIP